MVVIVLDNDETTGYYTHLMTYMNYVVRCRKLTRDEEVNIIPLVTQIALEHNIFRPGTAQFLKGISERKKRGIVSAVVMYTNAFANPDLSWHTVSWGVVDWPHFIARVLGCLAGDDTLFDVVLSRPPHLLHIPYPKKHFARIVDAIRPVCKITEHTRILFFDDKPDEILGASNKFIVMHAPEYKVPLTFDQIGNMLSRLLPFHAECNTSHNMIYNNIVNMSSRCNDSFIPKTPSYESEHWCGFNLDRELPLPSRYSFKICSHIIIRNQKWKKTRRIYIKKRRCYNKN